MAVVALKPIRTSLKSQHLLKNNTNKIKRMLKAISFTNKSKSYKLLEILNLNHKKVPN